MMTAQSNIQIACVDRLLRMTINAGLAADTKHSG